MLAMAGKSRVLHEVYATESTLVTCGSGARSPVMRRIFAISRSSEQFAKVSAISTMFLSSRSLRGALLLVLAFLVALRSVEGTDKYSNYAELKANEELNTDYEIEAVARASDTLIMAIHGGGIEKYTSELTIKAADEERYNYYLFEGIKRSGNWDLHITSTHFDEPEALDLVAKSSVCVTLHGFRNYTHQVVCVGGKNTNMVQRFMDASACETSLPFILAQPCDKFPGMASANIVNRCSSDGGLQLELSTALRDFMKANPGSQQEQVFLRMLGKTLAPGPVICAPPSVPRRSFQRA